MLFFFKDKSVKRGEKIIFTWKDKCGIHAKWMKDGQILEHGERISITRSDHKTTTLVISGAKEEDEGEYTLVVWTRKGEESGSAKVTVQGTFL